MIQTALKRKTLKQETIITGTGLHSGKKVTMRLLPAPSGTGIVFIPNSSSFKKFRIEAVLENVVDTSNAVTLGDGVHVIQTVEHLMAALHSRGISDLIIEIDSLEIPIMDGSALPFLEALPKSNLHEFDESIEPIRVQNPVWVVDGDKYLVILPSDTLKVTYHIDFNHPLLRGQSLSTEIDTEFFEKEILPARTFGFLRDVKALQAKGLALGGSLENAIVLSDDGYLNDSLRFENEFVRHKILDLIGDLSIIGRPIVGHIIASKAGHALDISMGKLLMSKVSGDEISKFKSRRFYHTEKRTALIS
ncbi:MAG: UDP-3-O-acyl-N-acetylglucosamine deacetylase [Leptospiraceae bacterium]|nr:UDP-3-O-acyl-N-acetylglucosamine deacetylase [Leptospiraceae bacterium]